MKNLYLAISLCLSGCASSLVTAYSNSIKQEESAPIHAPIEMIRLDKPRVVRAQLICNDSTQSWKIDAVSPALYLSLPASDSLGPAVLTTTPPACKRSAMPLTFDRSTPLDLIITNNGIPFHPEDRGNVPARALLQLQTGEIVSRDSDVRYLEKHHSLLYSRNDIPAVVQVDLDLQAYTDSLATRHSRQANLLLLATLPVDIATGIFLWRYVDGEMVAKALGIYLGLCSAAILIGYANMPNGH